MKKLVGAVESLAEKLRLPEEAVIGAARLSVVGGSCLFIENHRGLLEYGTERMRIKTTKGTVTLYGLDLSLEAMNKSELLVRGKIRSLEWE